MRWRGRRQSSNIEDRRGGGGGFGGGFRGGFGRGMGRIRLPSGTGRGRVGRRAGFGGLGLVAVIVIAMLLGVDPGALLTGSAGPGAVQPIPQSTQQRSGPDPLRDFVAVVLADTEDVWHALFQENVGARYEEPRLVLFTQGVQSACGYAGSAVGPFYCPGDRKVYLDLGFFRTLHDRFQAPGDFAQAYVIAHEVGHHVQTLLGISEKVHTARSRLPRAEANALSVRQELQADCFAGVWANRAQRTKNILESGDVDEALNAASAIGDDTLQRQAQGTVVPDSFTHGTSAQRQRWFKRGFEKGDLKTCDTFNAARL
jgi:predicted metalloprotease